MAFNWIHKCRIGIDVCDFVYEPRFDVGQAWMFLDRFSQKRWVQDTIRTWFKESENIMEQDISPLVAGKENNFTQVRCINMARNHSLITSLTSDNLEQN